MKRTTWGSALAAVVAISFQASTHAQTPPSAGIAPSLSMDCHLLYRGAPMKEPTSYQVIDNELYGISGPIDRWGRRRHHCSRDFGNCSK